MTTDERNAAVNEALDCRLDQLNSAFQKFEARVRAMRAPVDTSIAYAQWDGEPQSGDKREFIRCYANIGFVKFQGQWRLCHGYSDDYEPRDISWKPICEASIRERLAASKNLDKLAEAVIAEKERVVPEIENAVGRVIAAIERLPANNATDGRGDQ